MSNPANKLDTTGGCPPFEQVSEFFDGELDKDSPAYHHITRCPECQQRLDAYAKIGESLSRELRGAVPAGLADGVVLELKRERKRAEWDSRPIPFRVFLRLAALVAASLVALFLLTRKGLPGSETTEKSVLLADSKAPPKFMGDTPRTSATATPTAKRKAARFGNNVEMKNFMPVDSSGVRSPVRFAPGNAVSKHPAVRINPVVSQTWCVDDTAKAEALFSKYAKQGAAPVTKEVDPSGNAVLSCRLKKQSLVKLVRGMLANGCDLLSPAQPQPEQNAFAGKGDDVVSYRAVLVCE